MERGEKGEKRRIKKGKTLSLWWPRARRRRGEKKI